MNWLCVLCYTFSTWNLCLVKVYPPFVVQVTNPPQLEALFLFLVCTAFYASAASVTFCLMLQAATLTLKPKCEILRSRKDTLPIRLLAPSRACLWIESCLLQEERKTSACCQCIPISLLAWVDMQLRSDLIAKNHQMPSNVCKSIPAFLLVDFGVWICPCHFRDILTTALTMILHQADRLEFCPAFLGPEVTGELWWIPSKHQAPSCRLSSITNTSMDKVRGIPCPRQGFSIPSLWMAGAGKGPSLSCISYLCMWIAHHQVYKVSMDRGL